MQSVEAPTSPKNIDGDAVSEVTDLTEKRHRSSQPNQKRAAEAPAGDQCKVEPPKKPHSGARCNVRTTQVYLVAASRMMCYLARAQLGLLLPVLSRELRLTSADRGHLMSRYASGYLLTQIPGGILADRMGGYVVIASVIAATTACCIAAPILASYGSDAFGVPLFLLGLCQGVVMPAGNVLMSRWILPSERSWASAITGIGACSGTLIINLFAGPIVARWGWRAVFHSTAFGSTVFLSLWLLVASSSPDCSADLSEEELALLQQAGLTSSKTNSMNSKTKQGEAKKQRSVFNPYMFMHLSVWTIILCNFVQNCQQYFIEWLPFFYSTQLGVNPETIGFYLTIISFVEMPARAITLCMPEKLQHRGFSLLQSRKIMSLQGFFYHFLLCALLVVLFQADIRLPLIYTILFMLSKAVQSLHAGGYFANYLDVTQNYAGMLTGVGNTVASFAGVVVPQFVAGCLEKDEANWLPVFGGLILANIMAMSLISFFMSTCCLDDVCSRATKVETAGGSQVD
jgi:ACS family sodium-dependent inorganic phosphate cotransporter